MHLHQDLIRSGLRLRNIFDLPRAAYCRNDCSFHTFPPAVTLCGCLLVRLYWPWTEKTNSHDWLRTFVRCLHEPLADVNLKVRQLSWRSLSERSRLSQL